MSDRESNFQPSLSYDAYMGYESLLFLKAHLSLSFIQTAICANTIIITMFSSYVLWIFHKKLEWKD